MRVTRQRDRYFLLRTWDIKNQQIAKLDTSVLIRHVQQIRGQKFTMSALFSAGQYWICLEVAAGDDSLIIARVQLPRHPDTPAVATMALKSLSCTPSLLPGRALLPLRVWLPRFWKAFMGIRYKTSNLRSAIFP